MEKIFRSPTEYSFTAMRQRCYYSKHRYYSMYGGRGIKCCKRWKHFKNFLADMGKRPEGKTLDRIDNNKGYFKENCRWATAYEQDHNKRNNKWITYDGLKMIVADWEKKLGIELHKSYSYRKRTGWTDNEIIKMKKN